MKRTSNCAAFLTVILLALATCSTHATLTPIGPVQGPGGDSAASSFMASLPAINRFLAAQYRGPNLGEGRAFNKPESHEVDPLNLTMGTAFSARAYFIGEVAGYRNQLGFNSTGSGGPVSSQPGSLMFADASTTPGVLSSGSWVDLGIFAANTQLQFFLIADGVNKARGTYSTKDYSSAAEAAADGVTYDHFQHAIEFEKSFTGHNYIFIGFEDIRNGGDRDYNDSIFALELLPDFGGASVIPETGTWFAAASIMAYVCAPRFRRLTQKLIRT